MWRALLAWTLLSSSACRILPREVCVSCRPRFIFPRHLAGFRVFILKGTRAGVEGVVAEEKVKKKKTGRRMRPSPCAPVCFPLRPCPFSGDAHEPALRCFALLRAAALRCLFAPFRRAIFQGLQQHWASPAWASRCRPPGWLPGWPLLFHIRTYLILKCCVPSRPPRAPPHSLRRAPLGPLSPISVSLSFPFFRPFWSP